MLLERHRPETSGDLVWSNVKQEEFRRLMFAPAAPPRLVIVHGRCGTGKKSAIHVLLSNPPGSPEQVAAAVAAGGRAQATRKRPVAASSRVERVRQV